MKRVQRLLLIFFLTLSPLCEAKLIQIIHTNDLHSYFAGYTNGTGGYARVMTKIRQLREEARAKGIEVLQLDAGDWGEGTSFFLSDNGSDSVKALEMLGAEVAVIGNHDFQLGGRSLASQLRRAGVSTTFVGANIQSSELGGVVVPYADVEKNDISIRVIGLTTSEIYFQYSIRPGKILPPLSIGEREARKGKETGKELVIALTHIGFRQDKWLARTSESIDVIVGGHSHMRLNSIQWEKNKIGKRIPIVQAWAHGLAVGSLLLDVDEKGGVVKVVDYKLHEVSLPLASDKDMEEFVEDSLSKRNANLQFEWNEVIGETLTPMTGYKAGHSVNKKSCWGYHMATAAKEASGSSVGVHISAFEGVWKPAGRVTYADIADNFPHLRKFGDQGWEIATITLPGWKVKTLLYLIKKFDFGVTASGLGHENLYEALDEAVNDKALYSIAFPAEVALAIKTTFPVHQHFLRGLRYSGKYYWTVMADYIKKNSPISCP